MAQEIVNRSVNVYINSGEAQKTYDLLIAKEKKLNEELAKTTDPTKVKKLKAELDKLGEPITRAAKKLSGELGPSLRDQEALVRKLGNALKHMSTTDANFKPMVAQLQQAKAELVNIQAQLGRVNAAQKSVANTNPFGRVVDFAKGAFLAGGAIAVVQQFTAFISDSVTEALDADEAAARFKSTLENLGRGDAFDRIMEKADQLAEKFRYLDNDDIVGVFNKLIDYGKLTEKQMNDLSPVIINLAAKMRVDLGTATDVVVKALEGNGKALKQFGIDLSDTENTADRLQVVMGTLGEKVNGAADAFQNSAAGGIATARQELANMKEEVGNGLIPVFSTLLGWVNKLLIGFKELKKQLELRVTQGLDFIKGGAIGLSIGQAQREEAEAARIDKLAASQYVETFQGKSAEEIQAALIERQQQLAGQQKTFTAQKSLRARDKSLVSESQMRGTARAVRVLREEIAGLLQLQDSLSNTETLGIDSTTDDGAGGKTKYDKVGEDLKKLYKEIRQLQQEHALFDASEQEKEIARVREKYDKLRELAHGNKEQLRQLAELEGTEIANVHEKYLRLQVEAITRGIDAEKKRSEEEIRIQKEKHDKLLASMIAFNARLEEEARKRGRNQSAGAQLDVLKAKSPRERLDANLNLMRIEREQALANTDLTENEKALIREQYRQKEAQAVTDFNVAEVEKFLGYAQAAANGLAILDGVAAARENASLERDRKINDQKKKNLDKQLKGKLITQAEYDRKVNDLEREHEKKRQQIELKQFRRQQRNQVLQTLMNAAEGAIKLWANPGFPANLPLLALLALQTGASIATIQSQKPQFARGGKLTGRSHSEGGMPVVDHMGRKQAEVEGGEAIINKRTLADRRVYQLEGTPSQIASRLNGMHGVSWEGGARLRPTWRTAPARMNFAAISRSYATGGLFNSGAGSADQSDMMNNLSATVDNLAQVLDSIQRNGILAYTLLNQHNTQQARMDAIRNDATMK